MERATLLFWLWMLFFAVNVLWALGQSAVATSFGARPTSVQLGYGPTLFSVTLSGIRWSLRPIALGSSVSFDGPPPEGAKDAPPENRLRRLPVGLHLAVILVPWLFLVGVSMACLGAREGLGQFLSGFAIPFQPSALPGRLERFIALLQSGEVLRAWGLTSAKLAALNLLPVPMLAGGAALLLPWRNRPVPVWVAGLNFLALAFFLPWACYTLYLLGGVIFR
ncbi:hypothetical protein MYSTI_05553 [Myxococcus stipitatus DSM 14675]|uniref:Peptidase M50 domain-containing protein n=1 Tax=Myxococcus stipitatus (strain DSM 14675 / JCM 12634 / Mx s8) TaxID=1278073 RepID=L7UG09_MYXSD|nr:site-2 protease family protein [Myxococcus stipitatus]AGC46830.1 hypothetical protein MYSTI_05553 [Myxococcus stipitatus DSM 14675]